MNKCLVFTLPASVTDSNIPKLGVFEARIEQRNITSVDNTYFEIRMSGKGTATIIPDEGSEIQFTNSKGTPIGLTVQLVAGRNGLYASTGSGIIEIRNSNDITGLSGVSLNVELLQYLPNLEFLDLRNSNVVDATKRCYGDISGMVNDNIVTSMTVSQNNVTYDVCRLPNDVEIFNGGENNPIGMYCSSQKRKGVGVKVITTGAGTLLFSTIADAKNFLIANAECEWTNRENPLISVKTLEDSAVNVFANDAEVQAAIQKFKQMGVEKVYVNYFEN